MKWHLVLWCAALLLPSNALGVESEGASWWRSLSSTGSFRIALGPEGNLRTTDGQCVSSAGEPCTAFSQPKPREDNGHFQVSDIHIAPSGEIWSVGSFAWTVDFAPEGPPQVRRVDPNLHENAFLRKQAPDGRLLWVRTWPGRADQLFLSKGRVSVVGTFQGTVDFDPGAGKDVRTNPTRHLRPDEEARASLFISHYTEKGDYRGVWVVPSWLPILVTMSRSGELTIAGSFSGSEDLDPSAGQHTFRAAAARDAFVTVMRPDGSYGFTQTLPALNISDIRYSDEGVLWALANPLGPDGQTAFDYHLLRVGRKGMEVIRTYPKTSPSYGSGLAILDTFPDGDLLMVGRAGRAFVATLGRDLRAPEERSSEAQVLVSRFSREGAPEWTLVLPPAAELSSAVVSGSRVCLAMRLVGGPYDFSISGPAVMVGHRSVNGSSTPLVGCVEEQALRSVSLKR